MKRSRFKFLTVLILISIFLLLTGCEKVEFKSEADRSEVTQDEISAIQEKVLQMEDVTEFEIQNTYKNDLFAVLKIKDEKKAKTLAKDTFNLMWAETNGSVILFVKPADEEHRVLIQVFKPEGEDEGIEWDILID